MEKVPKDFGNTLIMKSKWVSTHSTYTAGPLHCNSQWITLVYKSANNHRSLWILGGEPIQNSKIFTLANFFQIILSISSMGHRVTMTRSGSPNIIRAAERNHSDEGCCLWLILAGMLSHRRAHQHRWHIWEASLADCRESNLGQEENSEALHYWSSIWWSHLWAISI